MNLTRLYDSITGPCIRKIKTDSKSVFLTFDDGPHREYTPKILALLKKHHAFATFFVVTNKIEKMPEIIQLIQDQGHAIGDHSFDHDTSQFFNPSSKLIDWIHKSQQELKKAEIKEVVGFRSPVGIKTPHLKKALKNLEIDNILWSIRFFDTQVKLRNSKILQKMENLSQGDIILLHDNQKSNIEDFLISLEFMIKIIKEKGFEPKALSKQLVQASR